MLIFHIILAVFSIVFSSLMYFSPSKNKILASYAMLLGVVLSGTFLIVTSHVQILRTCLVGLGFIAYSSLAIYLTTKKLAFGFVEIKK